MAGRALKKDSIPKPCVNCSRVAYPLRQGRCPACAMYWLDHHCERPLALEADRIARLARDATTCIKCGRTGQKLWKGRCHACDMYLRKHGIERPYQEDGRRERPVEKSWTYRHHRGEASPRWLSDRATAHTKRGRARKTHALGPCRRCGKPGTDRHHRDRNLDNNTLANIEILCGRCHGLEHKPPRGRDGLCENCGQFEAALVMSHCHTCYEYRRRHGKERPEHMAIQARNRAAKRRAAGQLAFTLLVDAP